MDVRCTPWPGEQDAKEFRDRQNSGHMSEVPGGWNGQASGSLLAVWKGPLTDKEREEASASSHWLDTVPGLS